MKVWWANMFLQNIALLVMMAGGTRFLNYISVSRSLIHVWRENESIVIACYTFLDIDVERLLVTTTIIYIDQLFI